jgi:tetratricopeptide (TPR) repeat protein
MPEIAPDITADELDKEVLEELRSLPNDLANLVGRHLVAAERALEDEDPERAHEHTKVARRFAARIGVVREAAGIVAYRAGHFSEALSDLRAARRLTGSEAYLPVMADCERGMGRPERAIDLVRSPEAERLDRAGRIELTIVESGARRDLGQHDAAVITLQRLPELRDPQPRPWSARLAFAYADALIDAGQTEAATEWFARAMAFDEDGETDAAERYAELTGSVIEDVEEDADYEDDFDDAGATDGGESAVTVDEEPEDDDASLAEADDLLGEEPEPAGAADDEDVAAATDVTSDEAAGRGDEVAEAPQADTANEAHESDDSDDSEGEDRAGDAAVQQGSSAGAVAAPAETPGITPAFIEPNFGDVLDEEDGPAPKRPKADD